MVSSRPRPHFTLKKDRVPILQEAGWAPGSVWTGGKSRPHRDSIPDSPARRSVVIPTELPGPLSYRCSVLKPLKTGVGLAVLKKTNKRKLNEEMFIEFKFLPLIFQTFKSVCEILLPLLLIETLYESSIFVFFRFYSSAIKQSPQAFITSSSQLPIPTTVQSRSSTLHRRRSVKLLD